MHPLLDLTAHPIVGHRGNAARAPENTIESFRQAVELGVDALELDVHLSGDGQVVVIHDPTFDRTTDRSGRVELVTLSEIQQADAGARFTADRGSTWPYRGRGITVPTLDDVLDAFPATPLLIEIKALAASRATREAIERHGAVDRCIVASFHEDAKDAFRGSGIARGASRRVTAGRPPSTTCWRGSISSTARTTWAATWRWGQRVTRPSSARASPRRSCPWRGPRAAASKVGPGSSPPWTCPRTS
jgi:glycerophosphoryl diester phosphodiesterase